MEEGGKRRNRRSRNGRGRRRSRNGRGIGRGGLGHTGVGSRAASVLSPKLFSSSVGKRFIAFGLGTAARSE